ncbi:MAG: hypothetical protein WBC61_09235, partial [Dehalococcoidia bacterium]
SFLAKRWPIMAIHVTNGHLPGRREFQFKLIVFIPGKLRQTNSNIIHFYSPSSFDKFRTSLASPTMGEGFRQFSLPWWEGARGRGNPTSSLEAQARLREAIAPYYTIPARLLRHPSTGSGLLAMTAKTVAIII